MKWLVKGIKLLTHEICTKKGHGHIQCQQMRFYACSFTSNFEACVMLDHGLGEEIFKDKASFQQKRYFKLLLMSLYSFSYVWNYQIYI